MEIDLQHAEAPREHFAQVCIVGAGIAGLTLAHSLSRQGVDVTLLEAGGKVLEDVGQSLFAHAQLSGQPHHGTTEGRFRAFGGSSLRWGGQLLPLPDEASTAWPIFAQDLAKYNAAAERMLGVDTLAFDAVDFFKVTHTTPPQILHELSELDASLSKWTPFSHRNLANTFGQALLDHPRVHIYLHAQATELHLAPFGAHIESLEVRNPAGKTFHFKADHFILAAGTVETCRLLQASRSVAPQGVGNQHGQVGRNFHDHVTLAVATITGNTRARLLQQLRPWIHGSTLHSLKLQASNELRKRLALNPVLAHLTIEEPEDSGIAAVRDVLLARQQGGLLKTIARHATQLPAAALEALKLVIAAKLHHRRYVSPSATVKLYLNAAQDTPSPSRITLAPKLDPSGQSLPIVDWHVTPNELATLRNFASHLRERFDKLNLEDLDWLPTLQAGDETLRTHIQDARHAMGGTCMGTDPRTSVVDPDLTVHGISNLSIASPAVFPGGSPPLPTLPLMALCLRLAERLVMAFMG